MAPEVWTETGEGSDGGVKRAQEGRNAWDRDVEAPLQLPGPVLRGAGL